MAGIRWVKVSIGARASKIKVAAADAHGNITGRWRLRFLFAPSHATSAESPLRLSRLATRPPTPGTPPTLCSLSGPTRSPYIQLIYRATAWLLKQVSSQTSMRSAHQLSVRTWLLCWHGSGGEVAHSTTFRAQYPTPQGEDAPQCWTFLRPPIELSGFNFNDRARKKSPALRSGALRLTVLPCHWVARQPT
jgi:hypothetical protein